MGKPSTSKSSMNDFFSAYNIELFRVSFITFRLFDIIDVLIVSIASYNFYSYIKGSVAAQIFSGLLTLVVASVIANFLQFTTLKWIVNQFISVWIVVVIILFQPEMRRVLLYLGTSPYVRKLFKGGMDSIIEDVIEALKSLQKVNTGALIIIARGTGLKSYIESGTPIDAVVSKMLLMSIFHKNSALHDGAVIIENKRVEAARCLLPLTANQSISQSFGTRHRAAIGITEVSDAIAIVLSEETGRISVAENGRLSTNITFDELRENFNSNRAVGRFSLFGKTKGYARKT